MNTPKRIIILCLVFVGLFGVLSFNSVNAQSTTLTQNQYELITGNCTALKSTLNQLHSNDALLRINAGQTYESILAKLMRRFNERVAYSNMNGDELEVVASNFELTLNTFRNNYVTYERQLSLIMDIDCMTEPQVFYDALMLAREYRNQLHDNVLGLNQAMSQYSITLDKFKLDNQALIERASR